MMQIVKGAHKNRAREILDKISKYEANHGLLIGIKNPVTRKVLVQQIISSIRRIEYIHEIQRRSVCEERSNPNSPIFDPFRSAIVALNLGDYEQSAWLVFLATYFGKHRYDGWKLMKNIYNSFGSGPCWTFDCYSRHSDEFEKMLHDNLDNLKDSKISGRYSNHRQYESKQPKDISNAVQSYYNLIMKHGGFIGLVQSVHKSRGQESTATFDELYKEFDNIKRFGRLGKFDFLTMIGKLQIASITPGSVYLKGATGPLRGANLLIGGNRERNPFQSINTLQTEIDRIDEYLHVGKQVIEDSLCNWQKSPHKYVYFRG